MPDPLVSPAVIADHDPVLGLGDGPHHLLLRVPALRVPAGLDGILFCLGKLVENEGVSLHGQDAPGELHALLQGPEARREERVVNAEPEQDVGNRAAVARAPVAGNTLQVSDLERADLRGRLVWHGLSPFRPCYFGTSAPGSSGSPPHGQAL